MDSLESGKNAPTVLQSLGCLAQYSVSTFESQQKVISKYIMEAIFQQNDVNFLLDCFISFYLFFWNCI